MRLPRRDAGALKISAEKRNPESRLNGRGRIRVFLLRAKSAEERRPSFARLDRPEAYPTVAAMIDWGQHASKFIRFGTLQEWDYSLRRRLSDTLLWLSVSRHFFRKAISV
jgi:hypothetical protein